MKTTKMSLANIQGKLTRNEMKKIMAGSGGRCSTSSCSLNVNGRIYYGTCGFYGGMGPGGSPLGMGALCECQTSYGIYQPSGGQSHCVV